MVFPSAKPHACSPGLLRGQSDHKNSKSGRKPLGSLEGHRELPTKRAGPRGSSTAGPALGEVATEGQPGPWQGLVVVSQTQAAPRSFCHLSVASSTAGSRFIPGADQGEAPAPVREGEAGRGCDHCSQPRPAPTLPPALAFGWLALLLLVATS